MTRRARDPELATAESVAMANITKNVRGTRAPVSTVKSAAGGDSEENAVGDGAAVSDELLQEPRIRSANSGARDEQVPRDPMAPLLSQTSGKEGSVGDGRIGQNSQETVAAAVVKTNAEDANNQDNTVGNKSGEVGHADADDQEVLAARTTTAEEELTVSIIEQVGHVPAATAVAELTMHTKPSAASQYDANKGTATPQTAIKRATKPTSGEEAEPRKVYPNPGMPAVSSLTSTALEPEKGDSTERGRHNHLLSPPAAGPNDAILSQRSRIRSVVFSRPHTNQSRREQPPMGIEGAGGPGPGHYDVQKSGTRERVGLGTLSFAPKRYCNVWFVVW